MITPRIMDALGIDGIEEQVDLPSSDFRDLRLGKDIYPRPGLDPDGRPSYWVDEQSRMRLEAERRAMLESAGRPPPPPRRRQLFPWSQTYDAAYQGVTVPPAPAERVTQPNMGTPFVQRQPYVMAPVPTRPVVVTPPAPIEPPAMEAPPAAALTAPVKFSNVGLRSPVPPPASVPAAPTAPVQTPEPVEPSSGEEPAVMPSEKQIDLDAEDILAPLDDDTVFVPDSPPGGEVFLAPLEAETVFVPDSLPERENIPAPVKEKTVFVPDAQPEKENIPAPVEEETVFVADALLGEEDILALLEDEVVFVADALPGEEDILALLEDETVSVPDSPPGREVLPTPVFRVGPFRYAVPAAVGFGPGRDVLPVGEGDPASVVSLASAP